jgi:hypothetical protein
MLRSRFAPSRGDRLGTVRIVSGFEHPECGDGLEFEGELALARGLVSSGEYSHGARHAAGCFAEDPTHPAVIDVLARIHAALGELAPDVVDETPSGGYWTGEAAVRAWMLRAVGRTEESSTLMLRVIGTDLTGPWARLLSSWVESDPRWPLPADAVRACGASVIQPLVHREPSEVERGNLVALMVVIERAFAQHPDDGPLYWTASGVARRVGEAAIALRWAQEGNRLAPSMESACMLGYARRNAGDERGAAEAFIEAARRSAHDPSPRLDAADSFANLAEWEAASTWATEAWDLDPGSSAAAGRACFASWQATGDPEWVLRLVEWVLARCPTPDPAAVAALGDAAAFAVDALQRLPWTAYVPLPANAAVNIARQIRAGQSDRTKAAVSPLRLTFSLPEAPSALLVLEHAVGAPVEIVTTTIPDPDPRLPRRKVKVLSWKLDRERLVPGGKAPARSALEAMYVTPSWLYTVAGVQLDAKRLVASNAVKAKDLVALATHPQPGPSEVDEADWIRRWQVVCCFGLARLGEFDVLADLADGPEDWLCDAAIAALAELARVQPRQREAVLAFAERHLAESARRMRILDLPHFGSECDAFRTVPGNSLESMAAASDLKASWLASYDTE